MKLISKIFRFIFRKIESVYFFMRIIKLKLLYPCINIDFKTKIKRNCSIVCIDGGKLTISDSIISAGTHIVADVNSTVTISKSFIGLNCVIASKEKVTISKSMIGEMCIIRDQNHIINDFKRFVTAPIKIEDNAWIASKVTILKGVTVGKNAVVAASAVVNKSIPENEVWGGIPAKSIRAFKPAIPVNICQLRCMFSISFFKNSI